MLASVCSGGRALGKHSCSALLILFVRASRGVWIAYAPNLWLKRKKVIVSAWQLSVVYKTTLETNNGSFNTSLVQKLRENTERSDSLYAFKKIPLGEKLGHGVLRVLCTKCTNSWYRIPICPETTTMC